MKWGTIIMPKEVWIYSQFSVARYYGGCKINGKQYSIVNKDGDTLLEISWRSHDYEPINPDALAIPEGEPADLVLDKWVPIYKALHRDRFLRLLQRTTDLKVARRYVRFIRHYKKKKGGRR